MNDLPADSSPNREKALYLVEHIRHFIVGGKLKEASEQIDALNELLAEWTRAVAEDIKTAREWLDSALQADLVLFNIEKANHYLAQWEKAVPDSDNPELALYVARVRERSQQKQVNLQIRGVIAHCEELWQKARELEQGDQPARPEFLLASYFTRARDIAAAAQAEHATNAELNVLLQKAERLRLNKTMAARLYPAALREEHYAESLSDLDKLPPSDAIPRYVTLQDESGTLQITFDNMISVSTAQAELKQLAQAWALQKAGELRKSAEDHLRAYQPQAALDALRQRESIAVFLKNDDRQMLEQIEQQARNDLRRLEQAEQRLGEALSLADDDSLQAWNLYLEARTIYPGALSLEETQRKILANLTAHLKNLMAESERAFGQKQMEYAEQLYHDAQQSYGLKHPTLDDMLNRMEEVAWQAHNYRTYYQEAAATLSQIKELVWQDAAAAEEMFKQLENYPELVLEDLPDLQQVQADVRKRLDVETTYTRLYHLLYSDNTNEVEQSIPLASTAAGENRDEPRFQQVLRGLQIHLMFLKGHNEQREGRREKALELITPVAATAGHPDQEAARKLIVELQNPISG